MATTIKLKNGSGAPLAGDLVQGEPALDLTNKRLYTEDSGGTVIEVGTNPSTLTVDGNVGIGTTTPVSLGAGYKNLDIRHTTGGGVTLGDASNIHAYLFSDNNGVTLQSPGSRSIKFTTVSTERMRIDSSGNLLVGTTTHRPATNNVNGVSIDATYGIEASVTSGGPLTLNRKSTDGGLISFKKDGSTKGNIGINGGDEPYFARNVGTTTGIKIANGALTACQSDGTNHDNAQDLGSSSIRWRNFHMAGDAVMGASSNIIYESGTTFNVRAAVANLTFQTNGANERMRIDSSGDVLIGTSATSYLNAANRQVCHVNGGTDGAILALTGTASGSYPGSTGDFYIASGASGTTNTSLVTRSNGYMNFYTNNTERMRIDSNGGLDIKSVAGSTAAYFGGGNVVNGITGVPSAAGTPFVLGRDTGTTRSAHFGGHLKFTSGYGIDFDVSGGSGTVSSNVLDDYEEGVHTTSVTAGSGTPSISSTENKVSYTAVGDSVSISGQLGSINCSGCSGALNVTMPFTTKTNTDRSDFYFLLCASTISTIDYFYLSQTGGGSATFLVIAKKSDGSVDSNVATLLASHGVF